MHFFKTSSLVTVLLASVPLTIAQSSRPAPSPSPGSAPDVLAQKGAGRFGNIFAASLGQPVPTPRTIFAPKDTSPFPSRLKERQNGGLANIEAQWRYQLSPDFKDAATLRGFTGSIVSTFESSNALLGGASQSIVSHGQRDASAGLLSTPSNITRRSDPFLQSRDVCTSSAPIHLFSGFGNNVTILQENIPFDGGIIHIVDG